jgi:hypothetical protein
MKFLSMCKAVALTVLLSLGAAPAFAQSGSLTTIFAHNNAFAGNTFDLTPTSNMTIDGFDVNVGSFGTTGGGAGETATIAIYWRNGTSDGFQSSNVGWTLLGTASVTSQGANNATHVPIGGLSLTAGQTYGIYVDLQNYNGSTLSMLYTNGGPTAYSNADLGLTTFYGKGNPAFSASTFTYRQWNGTVHYTKTQTCASEGYTGTKLEWCKNICERDYSGSTLNMWIRRWIDRYRILPYCALAPQQQPG